MITIDETVTWDLPEDAVVGDIIIKDGGDLRITDRTVLFKPGAGIVIEEGGQLLTSGATLDVCPQALEGLKWRGIYAPNSDSDITVALTQETIIRNAETGLLLGAQFRDGNGLNSPTVALNNAWFIDNNIGVNSLSNDLSQFNHCHFINNEFGIRLSNAGEEVEHLKIIYSEFIDNEFGIVAFNSSLRIDSENTFTGGRAGIVAGSTDPITSNIIIGRPSSNSGNTFTDMRQAIVIMGVGGPLGVSIINNTFSNIEGSAVQMIGESSFTVANNSFNNSGEGVFVTESGSMSNRIQCNTFTQSEKVDIILYGINTSTQFLENDYNSPNASYKNLAWSATLPDMGSEALSASNCFNDDVGINPDIRSVSSNNFTYYYKNTNECQEQEPNDLSSVLKLVANEPGNNCLNGIGPFNFIDPGNGNGGQVDINNFNAEFVCKSCVLDRIEYHKGQIVANGGNNPETGYVSVETPTTDLVKKEQLFEQWINFGLYVADEKKDYDFAENILSPLNDWKWKARYYGLSLQKEDFSEAANRLAALPNVNSNQAAFKSTQEINLKYLTAKASGTESEITKEDVETLKDIGLSYKLSSGYARTLLLLLTGEMLPTSIPELKEFINKDQAQEKEEVENSIIPVNETIAIFPNPARDYIQIKSESDVITQILLSDIYGKGVLKKRGNYLSTRVETTGLNTGIYLIQIQLENGELISQKIIIDN